MLCTALPAIVSGTAALLVNKVQTAFQQVGTLCLNQTNTTACMQIVQEVSFDGRMAVVFAGVAAGLSLLGAIGWGAMRIQTVAKKPEEQELIAN